MLWTPESVLEGIRRYQDSGRSLVGRDVGNFFEQKYYSGKITSFTPARKTEFRLGRDDGGDRGDSIAPQHSSKHTNKSKSRILNPSDLFRIVYDDEDFEDKVSYLL